MCYFGKYLELNLPTDITYFSVAKFSDNTHAQDSVIALYYKIIATYPYTYPRRGDNNYFINITCIYKNIHNLVLKKGLYEYILYMYINLYIIFQLH